VRRAAKSGGSRIERDPAMAIAGVVGLGLTALTAAITAHSSFGAHPELAAAARATIVAVPIAVGLYAATWRPYRRFGWMLAGIGAGWSVTALAGSTSSVAYSTGRVAGWVVELAFVWVILAFPSGRLSRRWDRALVITTAIIVVAGYMPTAFLADGYPTPAPWTQCDADCPANAFQVVANEPRFVAHGLPLTREALTVLVFIGVAALLVGRIRSATRLTRLMLAPVLAVAVARLVIYVAALAWRGADAGSPVLEALVWTIALLVPVMAVAFLVGLLRWQLFSAVGLQRLAGELHEHPDAQRVRNALAATIGDPWLDLAFWKRGTPGEWVDTRGEPVDLAQAGRGRAVTTIDDGDAPMAAIIHDVALEQQQEFIRAAGNYAAIALHNHQLVAQVRASLQEVQQSRTRILASADAERRRIERDLHDGAQQRLVALRIKLELAEEMLAQDPPRGRELLHEIGDETIEALEDVRSLAHGVYPALLTQRGLREALRDAALRSPIPVQVDGDGVGRYAAAVESAIYFCCMEAMQNTVKHGLGATGIAIGLSDDGGLRFEVADDGVGFDLATTPPGAGFENMRDRLAAVGGELTFVSELGQGARVVGIVPKPS
jgi:signal transduction histidine kinase